MQYLTILPSHSCNNIYLSVLQPNCITAFIPYPQLYCTTVIMMAIMKPVKVSFGISILLLLYICLLSAAQDTFHVTPVSELACDGRDPCSTLSGYTAVTQNGPFDSIPNSSVTLIFLRGSHLIADISVVISGIASFTMAGDPDFRTEINCTESLRFGFVDIGEVSISDLTFLSCGLDVTAVGLFELSSSSVLNHTLRSAVSITSSSAIAIRSCNFSGNGGGVGDGGAVSITSSSVELTSANFSDNNFSNNTAGQLGGGVFIDSATAVFSGNNIFANNFSPQFGGAMAFRASVTTFCGSNTFIGNQAMSGGAVIFTGLLDINGNTTFAGNHVMSSGGAIFISENSSLSAQGVITLVDNAAIFGGGIWVEFNSSARFRGSAAFHGQIAVFGGAIAGIGYNVSFDGDTIIEENFAMYGGGIASVFNCMVTFNGSTRIKRNVGTALGGGILAIQSTFVFTGEAVILLNLANQDGGGCAFSRSILSIAGNMTFDNNAAELSGGGMILSGDSEIVFQPMTELRFTNNIASRGGAIVIDDSITFPYCAPVEIPTFAATRCFYQFPSYRLEELPPTDVTVFFEMNNASEAGADFYGGLVDSCYLEVEGTGFNPPRGQPSFAAVVQGGESLKVSSDPIRVCVCEDGIANCIIESVDRRVFPGGMVEVFVVALGQRNGTVPALVQAEVAEGKDQQAQIARLEASQPIRNTCSSISYTVLAEAENSTVTIQVYPRDGPCPPFVQNVSIVAEILPCPVGFEFSESERACVCDNVLVEEGFTTVCNISDQIIHRNGEFWMGFDSEKGLILHPHCPFDYCITEAIDVPIVNGNVQCDNNRAGHICGQCSDGFSLTLGSSKCMPCTNAYLALLIVFIVAGIALVIFLLVFKLTVSEGTMNALVFYANIVHVNESVFFPSGNHNFLRGFIAWINLDLGIETCFYDGMNAYAKAWLQFIFPVYVWALIFVFITVGHFSPRVAKMLGSNPVTVLATLFLLSYTKVLRAIIVPLSVTKLRLADSSKAVWFVDGNVEYFQGRHIPLFLFSVAVLLFIFLPYTFLLFFGQWIQQLKICRWMNGTRFRAFLDAYWAPYTPKYRYWTGLLLLLRCILFLVNALGNARNDSGFNLVIICCVSLGLVAIPWINCRIYKKWYLEVLEASFILNLGVLAVASIYIIEVRRNETAETILVSFSAGIAFVEFIGIIIFHSKKQLSKTRFWSRAITYHLSTTTHKNSGSKDAPGNATGVSTPVNATGVSTPGPTGVSTSGNATGVSERNSGIVTSTAVPKWPELELSPQRADFSQLREPILDDV